MVSDGGIIQTEAPGPRLINEMVTCVCSPRLLGQVRIPSAYREDEIENRLPIGTEAGCVTVCQRCEVLTELVFESFARQNGEGVVHLARVAVEKSLSDVQLRPVVRVDREVNVHILTVGPEAVRADLLVAEPRRV